MRRGVASRIEGSFALKEMVVLEFYFDAVLFFMKKCLRTSFLTQLLSTTGNNDLSKYPIVKPS